MFLNIIVDCISKEFQDFRYLISQSSLQITPLLSDTVLINLCVNGDYVILIDNVNQKVVKVFNINSPIFVYELLEDIGVIFNDLKFLTYERY